MTKRGAGAAKTAALKRRKFTREFTVKTNTLGQPLGAERAHDHPQLQ